MNEFSIQPNQTKEYLPYDEVTKTFSLKHAGHHFEFLRIMHDHQDEMAEYEKQIRDTEKRIDISSTGSSELQNAENSDAGSLFADENWDELLDGTNTIDTNCSTVLENSEHVPVSTLAQKQTSFRKEDQYFCSIYEKFQNKMWKYYDQKRIDQFVHDLREKYSSDWK